MAEVFTWTTADLEFVLRDSSGEVPEGLLEGVSELLVTISQTGSPIEKRLTNDEVVIDPQEAIVSIHLTQAETGKLKGGTKSAPKKASCQVNIYYATTQRSATYETELSVLRNLHPKRLP